MKIQFTKISLTLAILVLFATNAIAQVTGTKVIPTDYATLAAAITDLNTNGVGAGGATITFASSYTAETAPIGGYSLGSTALNATLSAANPLVFDGTLGGGARVNLKAYSPQSSGSITDAIWKLNGTDWVTIQYFSLLENPLNGTTTIGTNNRTEFGFVLCKLNATAPFDGCNHVTIQNDSIALNLTTVANTLLGGNSGIFMGNYVMTTSTTAPLLLATGYTIGDAQNDNVFRANVIHDCNSGIFMTGYGGYTTTNTTNALNDKRNLIGGTSPSMGNIIYNFGGNATGFGVGAQYDDSLTIRFNTFKTDTVTGCSITAHGFWQGSSSGNQTFGANLNVSDNTFKLVASTTNTGTLSAIQNFSITPTTTAPLNNHSMYFQRNTVSYKAKSGSSNLMYGIWNNGGTVGNLYMTDNVINLDTVAGTGTIYGIANGGWSQTAGGVFYDTANTVQGMIRTSASGSLYGIYNTGTSWLNGSYDYCLGNKVINNKCITAANTNAIYAVYDYGYNSTNYAVTKKVLRNTVSGNRPGGSFYGYYTYGYGNAVSGVKSSEFAFNTLTNNKNVTSGSYTNYMCYISSTYLTAMDIHDNVIDNNAMLNTSTMYGYYLVGFGSYNNGLAAGTTCNIYNNKFTNDSLIAPAGTGTLYGIYCSNAGTAVQVVPTIYKNEVAGLFSYGGIIYPSYLSSGGAIGSGLNIINFYQNNIHNIQSNQTATAYPIYGTLINGGNVNYYNNFISDIRTPTASSETPVQGIAIGASAADVNVYNNTVFLNPVSTGAIFGAVGLYFNTAGNIDLRNNIFYVNAVHKGIGCIAAIRRGTAGTVGVAPTNLKTTSNNNLLYAPAADTSFLYVEGAAGAYKNGYNVGLGTYTASVANNLTVDANFNTGCGAYKTFMSPRESGTFVENTLQAAGANTFTPTASTATFAYLGGQDLSAASPAVTTDYAGNPRPTPFPSMGALEFTSSSIDATAPTITYTTIPNTICNAVAPVLTANITDASGVGGARLYYRRQTEDTSFPASNTAAYNGWKYVDGVLGVGTSYSFTLDYSLLTAMPSIVDTIRYFVVATDNNFPTANGITKSITFASSFCPTSTDLASLTAPATTSKSGNYFAIDSPRLVTSATLSSNTFLCLSGLPTFTASPSWSASAAGLTYQWYHTGGTGVMSPISGAITYTYTPASAITATDTFAVRYVCNGTAVDTANSIREYVSNPVVDSVFDATRCGTGTALLRAHNNLGSNLISWFATQANALAGVSKIGVDTTRFVTPSVATSTPFWLAAAEGPANINAIIGTGATTATGSGSNPITDFYEGDRNQSIILASELAAKGFVPGKIDSLGFTVSSALTSVNFQQYKLKIFSTNSVSNLSGGAIAVPSSAILVNIPGVNSATITGHPFATTGRKMYALASSFVWDGTSNIIIDMCHDNATAAGGTGGYGSSSSGTTATVTSFVSNAYRFADGAASCGVASTTTSTTRPDYILFENNRCYGTPVKDSVIVNPPAAITLGNDMAICNGAVGTVALVSTAGFDVLRFKSKKGTALTNLYSDAAGTVALTVNDTTASAVYYKNTTPGRDTVICYAYSTALGCANTDTIIVFTHATADTLTATPASICASGTAVITLTPNLNYTTGANVWSKSSDSITFVNMTNTANTYTTGIINSSDSFYKVTFLDYNSNVCRTVAVKEKWNNPLVTNVYAGFSSCGPGIDTLFATAAGNTDTLRWYSDSLGNSAVGTGSSFVTPTITASTPYWVFPTVAGANYAGGIIPTANYSSYGYSYGLQFKANQPFKLNTVRMYPHATGTTTVYLYKTNFSTVYATKLINLDASYQTTGQIVNLNFNIADTGTYYIALPTTGGVACDYQYNSSGSYAYPYNLGSACSITAGHLGGTAVYNYYWCYFYDWKISTGCTGASYKVIAPVTTPPAFSLGNDTTVCNNSPAVISVKTNTADFNKYQFTRKNGTLTNLYSNASCTTALTAADTALTTIYYKSVTPGYDTIICSAKNSTSTCANKDTVLIWTQPSADTLTASPKTICVSGSSTVLYKPDLNYPANTVAWYNSTDSISYSSVINNGNTYGTTVLTANNYYRVTIKDGSGASCHDMNFALKVTNPNLSGVTVGVPTCGAGVDTVFATLGATTDSMRLYSDSLGSNQIASSGGSYILTPTITATSNFWLFPTAGVNQFSNGGILTSAVYSYTTSAYATNFTTISPIILNKVTMYPHSTGTNTVSVYAGTGASGTLVASVPVALNVANQTTGQVVNLNIAIPTPGNYYLTMSGSVSCDYQYSGGTATPYAYPYSVGTTQLTSSSLAGTTTYNYYWAYFYNWTITELCRGASYKVTAPVTPADTISATITRALVCPGTLDSVNAVSTNAGYIYDVYENSLTGTHVYTGTVAGNLSNAVVTPSATVSQYVVRAHNNTTGCAALATVTVGLKPAATAFTLSLPNVCPNGTDTFTANGVGANYTATSISRSFLPFTGTTLCNASTQTVALTSGSLDDGYWNNIHIPFTFNYYGQKYDSIAISTNGNIQFVKPQVGTVLTPSTIWTANSYPIPTTSMLSFVGGVWGDYYFTSTGSVSYNVTGTTPNRKFYITYLQTASTSYHSSIDTSQIVLFENTNEIQVHSSAITSTSSGFAIGINNQDGTKGVVGTQTTSSAATMPAQAWSFSPIPLGTYAWSGPVYTGTFTNVNTTATAPLTTATPSDAGTYTMVFTDATTGCKSTNTGTLMLNTPTNANGLAAVSGGSQICQSYNVGTGWKFNDGSCDWIAKVTPAGASPVTGMVNSCAKVDATVQTYLSKPYAPRHWDITPTTNASTATANVTLYVDQATFNSYNATAGPLGYAAMPTGPTASTASLLVHQYHGTGTAPGNYTGTDVVLTPTSVTWNANFNWWEVTVPVTGFSGFYLETKKPTVALTVMLQGPIQAGGTMVNWLQVDSNYANSSFLQPRLPVTDPYGVGVTYNSINDTTGNSLNPGAKFVTDWVNVETRKVSAPSVVVESRALLLKPNGSIVDTNRAVPAFKAIAEPMFFVVKQRNHLAVQSATLSSLLSNTVYDFTTGLTQAYSFPGDPDPMVLSNGKWCMWTADIVNDGIVDAGDLTFGLADYNSGSNDGYLLSDLNMDGLVEAFDLTILSNNYNNIVSSPILNY